MDDQSAKDYLEGELNAVKACATAISEAVEAIRRQNIKPEHLAFVLVEFQGVMLRASMIIEGNNKRLGIKR